MSLSQNLLGLVGVRRINSGRKVLYGQKEALSSIPRTQVKKQTNKQRTPGCVTHICNPSAGDRGDG